MSFGVKLHFRSGSTVLTWGAAKNCSKGNGEEHRSKRALYYGKLTDAMFQDCDLFKVISYLLTRYTQTPSVLNIAG
jgi:hypothetical protein